MAQAESLRQFAKLCRDVAGIPTTGGHHADRALLILADKLYRQAAIADAARDPDNMTGAAPVRAHQTVKVAN
jgi:hypothetical protein